MFTLHQDNNLGCPKALQDALDWFFNLEECGVILEHDMLPDQSFFHFCSLMLDRYRDNERVMHISGNFFQPQVVGDSSYYFSHIPHIWGWATWRRTWRLYDVEMKDFMSFKRSRRINKIFFDILNRVKWEYLFERIYLNKLDTWDFQLVYTLMNYNGLSVIPGVNLVSNIGFGKNSLHSQNESSSFANVPSLVMRRPLKHPLNIEVNRDADLYTSRHNFYCGFKMEFLMKIGLFNLIKRVHVYLKML